MSGLPLDGVRVVAVEHAVAAPLCTRHMADLGAEVVKVERPEGDFARRYDSIVLGESAYFVWLNRAKRSVALDLGRPDDRVALDRLIDSADVLVHNLGPGAIDRLGLGWGAAHAQWPRLLWVSISGYGMDGPYRERKAFDLLVQAETGVIAVTGSEDAPAKVGISIADIAGGLYAFASILAALRQRDRDGEGRRIDISLFDCLAEWMTVPAYQQLYGASTPPRTGTRHASIAPYGTYRCADGLVTLAVQNERQWTALCERVLGRPDLVADARFADNPSRHEHRRELETIVEGAFATRTRSSLERDLNAADIPYAALNSVADLIAHPQLTERGRWRDVATPGGVVRALLPPFNISGVEPVMGAVPALDAHGEPHRKAVASSR